MRSLSVQVSSRTTAGLTVIGDDVAAALPELRAQAESMMTAHCVIRMKGPGFVFDPVTKTGSVQRGDVVYSGKCRVRPSSSLDRNADLVGEQRVTTASYVVRVPVGVSGVVPDCVVTIDQSNDPHMQGREVSVINVNGYANFDTALRIFVIDNQG